MKNDFDFIKDKLDNSGVNAPADMDEDYVMKTLEGVYPQPIPMPQPSSVHPPKKKRKTAAIVISSVAAALVLTITLGIVLRFHGTRGVSVPGGLTLKRYTSYAQVEKDVINIQRQYEISDALNYFSGNLIVEDYAESGRVSEDMPAEEGYAGDSSGSAAGGSQNKNSAEQSDTAHSETYEQVEGVNEADFIKTDGKYIYCVDNGYFRDNKVVIFTANGKDSEKVAEIHVFNDDEATPDEANRSEYYYNANNRSITEMYLKDDRLIVICEDGSYSGGYHSDMMQVKVYDISDIDHITLVDTFTQSGHCDSDRMIGDMLYLVSSYVTYDGCEIPACGRGEEPDLIPVDCIYSTVDNDMAEFLVVSAYNTADQSAQTESKTILGRVDDIYCNLDHLYIYSTHHDKKWYESFDLFGDSEEDTATTQIIKVDLSDGIDFSAYGEVIGTVDDQYALDEYQGCLRIATTTKSSRDSNNLFVLNEELSVIGSVTGFARNESIKAVRYVGETAYVITYEQTDPLFVIDLSDPFKPTIMGEAKISGFSTMLVPIDENTILGLGYQTSAGGLYDMEVQNGFKVVLFDVSNKLDPKVLDTLIYEDCSSAVQYNPKALVYNPDRDDYIVPLNYYHWAEFNSDASDVYEINEECFGGVLNFKIENNQLVEVERYKADYDSVDRCVYVGDDIYMTYHEYDKHDELKLDSVPYKK